MRAIAMGLRERLYLDLSGEASEKLARLLNLCARPRLDGPQREEAERLAGDGELAGIERLLLHGESAPLVAAALGGEGVPGWADGEGAAARAALWFRQRGRIASLLTLAAGACAGPVVVIKGAWLAHVYPQGGVRSFADVDLVVEEEDRERVAGALERAGYVRPRPGETVLRDAEGRLAVDIQSPRTPFGRELFEGALPWEGGWGSGVRRPRAGHHLVLTGLHCFSEWGTRVWRDVADARVLMAGREGWRADYRGGMEQLSRPDRSAVRAFLWFARGGDAPPARATVRHRWELLRAVSRLQVAAGILHQARRTCDYGPLWPLFAVWQQLRRHRHDRPQQLAREDLHVERPKRQRGGIPDLTSGQRLMAIGASLMPSLAPRSLRAVPQLARAQLAFAPREKPFSSLPPG